MRLYEELDERVAAERADEWADDTHLQDFSEYVEETVATRGDLDPYEVASHFENEDDPDTRRYGYLRGIDWAMRLVHPDVDVADRGGMDALAVRFRRFNRFNTDDADGALLPRFAFPDRFRQLEDEMVVEGKPDLFDFVTAVSPGDWAKVTSVRLARHLSPPPTIRLDGLIVGCAPVCGGRDVKISCDPPPPRRRYYVTPSMADPSARIRKIIENLDASGAHVGVMPELTLDPGSLAAWQDELSSAVPPPGSELRLIFVGTGALDRQPDGRVANRGVLLDRSGRKVLEQDKRHSFTLTEEMVRGWGLLPELGPGAAAEPIVPAGSIKVAEAPFGRMVILICEDLGRTVEDGRLLLQIGPWLCLAPVFSKPTLPHYWEHSRAKELSAEIGSHTVVANSLVIQHRQEAAGLPVEGHGTALAHSPANFEVAYTEDPGAVVGLRLHPDGAFVLA